MPAKEPAIKSDLDRIDKLRDEDIDYSDIPELGDDMFAKPLAPWPPKKETISKSTSGWRGAARGLDAGSTSDPKRRLGREARGWTSDPQIDDCPGRQQSYGPERQERG
jgi:hypothetical protein